MPRSGSTTLQTHGDAGQDAHDIATPASKPRENAAAQQPRATPSADASNTPGTPPPIAGEGARPASEPAAGGGAKRAGEPAEHAGAGGSTGAADGGADNARQSLIEAALEALGGPWDGGVDPWTNGGQRDRLSAEFVKSVLYAVVGTGVCFVPVPPCVQLCFAIATDCSPCADDPECAEALKSVCGPLGTCAGPE